MKAVIGDMVVKSTGKSPDKCYLGKDENGKSIWKDVEVTNYLINGARHDPVSFPDSGFLNATLHWTTCDPEVVASLSEGSHVRITMELID